jgi:hypothetical protein
MSRQNKELLADIDLYFSEKGEVVIHIDTPGLKDNEQGPMCRVYLNDGDEPIWDNTEEHPHY